MIKICNKCGETKELNEFYRNANMKDGILNTCKKCRRSEIEQMRKTDKYKQRMKKHRASWNQRFKGDKKNKNKIAAWNAVYYALKTGKLIKEPCEICGSDDSKAHHDDYTKRLEVRWLCGIHHSEWHANNEAIK